MTLIRVSETQDITDLSIFDYCRWLKGMVDALGDLGEVVLDLSLVLTTLHGLNGRFFHMAALLKRQRPFPMFAQVRNDLQLDEIQKATKPGSSSTALVSTIASTGHIPSFAASIDLSTLPPPMHLLQPRKSPTTTMGRTNVTTTQQKRLLRRCPRSPIHGMACCSFGQELQPLTLVAPACLVCARAHHNLDMLFHCRNRAF
jgi:hypothetical protein